MKVNDLIGKRVGAFLSGGLDSTTITKWLSEKGVEVVSMTIDLGQPDEKNIGDIAGRMLKAGAVEAITIDGKPLLAEYMLQVIQGLGHHEGGYMNTTGIARMAAVQVALPEIMKRKLDIIVHGATGRGNDQVRFELAPAMLEPDLRVYAPWRDTDFINECGGRKEMIEFCQRQGLGVSATLDRPYSTDANFCGLTHEAGRLERITERPDYVKFLMGVRPQEAPDKEEIVSVCFGRGRPIVVNGQKMKLVPLFLELNKIVGRNGVAVGIDVVENRRVGIKSRGVYESPAATLLEIAYGKLLELIMDRDRRKFFEIVSRQWADVVYEGEFFSPKAGDLLAVITNVARQATGEITYALYKGGVYFIKAEGVVHSLYDPDRSSMEKVGDFNHTDSQGYLNIAGVLARAMARAGQTRRQ